MVSAPWSLAVSPKETHPESDVTTVPIPEHHGNRLDHFGLLVLFIPLHPHPSIIMSQTLHSAVARGLREAGAVLREQGAAEVSVCRFPG